MLSFVVHTLDICPFEVAFILEQASCFEYRARSIFPIISRAASVNKHRSENASFPAGLQSLFAL